MKYWIYLIYSRKYIAHVKNITKANKAVDMTK